MTGLHRSYVETAAGQVHVTSVAGAGVPGVFFHQTASSGRMWHATLERLAGTRGLHAFDTPGFGGSFDPPREARPSLSDYVSWLHAALEAAGIGRAHLVGHHTGACIATEMAARHPELACSLTLVGPVPLTAEERADFSRSFGAPFVPTATGSHLAENWDYLVQLGADRDPHLINREMADYLRAWWGRFQAYNAVWGQDFTQFYLAVRCPILIGAAPDDVLFPFVARAAELRPDAELMTLAGANFEPDLDADAFAAQLGRFLARHDG
jgi:pimeloyl-ACP methyl ester carboxylesterase